MYKQDVCRGLKKFWCMWCESISPICESELAMGSWIIHEIRLSKFGAPPCHWYSSLYKSNKAPVKLSQSQCGQLNSYLWLFQPQDSKDDTNRVLMNLCANCRCCKTLSEPTFGGLRKWVSLTPKKNKNTPNLSLLQQITDIFLQFKCMSCALGLILS